MDQIGLPLGMGSFGEFFGFYVFLAFDFSGLFLFLFLFSAGREKRLLAHGILVGNYLVLNFCDFSLYPPVKHGIINNNGFFSFSLYLVFLFMGFIE